jgi:hypothetical protein
MIKAYFRHKGWIWFGEPGHLNVLYFEDSTINFEPVNEELDAWNDIRAVFDAEGNCIFKQIATTEPGLIATNSKKSAALGGVFRIAIGQHLSKWAIGWHNSAGFNHAALVQRGSILGYRDKNRDGKRIGDPVSFATGVNQHSTALKFKGSQVGNFSAGCLVGKEWAKHIEFMQVLQQDARFIADKSTFLFSSTIIDASDYYKFVKNKI